jgi:hypothetical protein
MVHLPTSPRTTRAILAALAAAAVAACGSASVGGHASSSGLASVSATRQTGRAGQAVGSPPAVKVVDPSGTPVAGVTVSFAVTGGGGVSPATGVSGSDGIVRTAWQLGASGPQSLRATAAAIPGAAVDFSAQVLAGSGYEIDLRLLTTATDSQWAAFTGAADRIAQVVVGQLPPMDLTGLTCGGTPGGDTALHGSVQNLLILVWIHPIDGGGKILGQAGPCVARSGSSFPSVGFMELDSADLASLETSGKLQSVILHEMLHVVGFGTMWDLHSPSLISGAGTVDSAFTGAGALAAATGSNFAPSTWTSVPLENCGALSPTPCGAGTQDSHWLEPTFKNELMTGWLSGLTQPFSATTVGSLADLGYTVDLAAADPFNLTTAGLEAEGAAGEAGVFMGDDVVHVPVVVR